MSIYRCYVQDYNWKVAKFLIVKNKAHCKRLPIYSSSFLPNTSASGFLHLYESFFGFYVGVSSYKVGLRTLPIMALYSPRHQELSAKIRNFSCYSVNKL